MLYNNHGHYDKARPLLIKCLEKFKSTLGENHPYTLTTMHGLARFYDKQGEYENARSLRAEFKRDSGCTCS
jgi:hypothetical protein